MNNNQPKAPPPKRPGLLGSLFGPRAPKPPPRPPRPKKCCVRPR